MSYHKPTHETADATVHSLEITEIHESQGVPQCPSACCNPCVEKVPDLLLLYNVFSSNWFLTALLIFIPLGFTSYLARWPDTIVFSFNFLAIIPLAWLIGRATEDLAEHTGQIAGGLLNATFGNVVEMLLCVAGLRENELTVVQCTLMGSMLSNLLLVLGCSFIAGGFFYKTQRFSAEGASTNSSLMTLSCLCLVLPTVYATILSSAYESELQISRSVSVLLALTYAQYIVFQLGTHTHIFLSDGDEAEENESALGATAAIILLSVCTILVSFVSEYLVSSIQGVVDSWDVSKEFIGIILLPIIGNAAEHYTAVVCAAKNKMDLSLGVAVGSSCQIALCVTPFAVLVGWAMGREMTLNFHPFMVTVFVLSVLIVTGMLADGTSNWLEGSMLVTAYIAVALIYFFESPGITVPL
eukprot:Platyproteum_vivax@DN5276_c0_g1_i1.p1